MTLFLKQKRKRCRSIQSLRSIGIRKRIRNSSKQSSSKAPIHDKTVIPPTQENVLNVEDATMDEEAVRSTINRGLRLIKDGVENHLQSEISGGGMKPKIAKQYARTFYKFLRFVFKTLKSYCFRRLKASHPKPGRASKLEKTT